ncbi:MmcQ/YjbR family DNA-binding protein [Microlunatus sp. Gsoil 973]|uniref:MmcQ/YjbR family DNA-binding protein n=1 Tax=Microlunatus sp. Gsoil 973 TaxID=2672569 RepID=UPI0012B44464|nr:hypothetical protein [Microlunatus sp. Gsoil 973]QGN32604.1 hypothetical protein GJV80_07055 [Microlunatus sp. Gsoil 973]
MAPQHTWESVTALIIELPEVEFDQGNRHFPRGVIRVHGKVIAYPAGGPRGSPPDAREGEEFVFIKTSHAERAALFTEDPITFFTTPHYQDAPGVIVRLSTVDPSHLRQLLIEAWRLTAPKRLIAQYEQHTAGLTDQEGQA